MARLAALHAMGDVRAMAAAPQAALLSVVLPPLSPALRARTLAEIIAGAAAELRAAGADLVGGHTTEGAEMTLGLALTGLAPQARPQGGARPGDALILTRPLGSGTVFAAAMAGASLPGRITGEAVAEALAVMLRPGGAAAAVLAARATAMTDVTGFGLAGHLLGLLDAAGVAAEIEAAAIPLLPGAAGFAEAGIRAHLWAANRAAAAGRVAGPDGPAAILLFDPQTAGGLLAAVPAALAAETLAALRASGEPAAIIGRIVAGSQAIRLA
jgi:selenide,water dikinase